MATTTSEHRVTTPEIQGRAVERRRLLADLEGAQRGAATLVWIEGGPGSGKTTLARWARRQVEGWLVVEFSCYEGEADLSLAALASLLRPLRRFARHLLPAAQDAFESVVGGTALLPDRYVMSVMVLELLARAAEDQPLLVVVDDVQWMDAVSAQTLGFAVRRLVAESVAVIVTSRPGMAEALRPAEESVLELGPLDAPSARAVLMGDDRSGWAPHVLDVVIAETGGVPLALIEVARLLSADQRAGRSPLPPVLPIGTRLTSVYGERIAVLDVATRMVLAVLAAAGSDPAPIAQALKALGVRSDALGAAERTGVVERRLGTYVFTHPLQRTAALRAVTADDLRSVHEALAAATPDGERQALHVAKAAPTPSEMVAARLAERAEADFARRGVVAAASVWSQAASLTPPGSLRERRLLTAGSALIVGGRAEEAAGCLRELLSSGATVELEVRADALVLLSRISVWTTDAVDTAGSAVAAADQLQDIDPLRARRLLTGAIMCLESRGLLRRAASLLGHPSWKALSDTVLPAGYPEHHQVLMGDTASLRRMAGPDAIRVIVEGVSLADEDQYFGVTAFAQALGWDGRFESALAILEALAARGRTMVAPGALGYILGPIAESEWWLGRWDVAVAHIQEGISLAEQTGQPVLAAYNRTALARIYAGRGLEDATYGLCNSILADADRYAAPPLRLYALQALGLLHLGSGDASRSVEALLEADRLAIDMGVGCPGAVPYQADLVEALHRDGRHVEAEAALARLHERARRTRSAWAASSALRLQAMLNPDGSSDTRYAEAIEQWPIDGFDQARTLLVWGQHRLHHGDLPGSQHLLARALKSFERLGAAPWAARTRQAMRSAGLPPKSPKSPSLSLLTPQELQVALTVARGLTNRQSATELFVSPKTIEHHLSRIYQKLGIKSRTQLTRTILGSATASEQ